MLFSSHCTRYQYSKSSTRWKKLIMFIKDMAVATNTDSSLPYHTTFIQLT